jgi:hypothetical protein
VCLKTGDKLDINRTIVHHGTGEETDIILPRVHQDTKEKPNVLPVVCHGTGKNIIVTIVCHGSGFNQTFRVRKISVAKINSETLL